MDNTRSLLNTLTLAALTLAALALAAGLGGCRGSVTIDRGGVLSPGDIDLVRIEAGRGVPRAFLIGRCEVTQRQFKAFIDATGYDGADHPSSKPTETFLCDWVVANGRRTPRAEFLEYPVCNLNHHHARAYCAWLSKVTGRTVRLPSDDEWTLAARGREGRTYPWGETFDERRCNYGSDGDGFARAAPVGSFPRGATPEGVLDMAGNIWEWSEQGNLRGGPWCMGQDSVRSDKVAHEDPNRCDDKFGLRIVVECRE